MHKCHNIPDDTESPSQTWNAMGKLTLYTARCCETPGRKSNQGQQKRRFLSSLAHSQSFFVHQTSWNIMFLVLIVIFGIGLRLTMTFCSLTFLAAKDFLGSWDTTSRSVWTSKDPHGWLWSIFAFIRYLFATCHLAHRAKRGARVLISTCVESCYTRGDWWSLF